MRSKGARLASGSLLVTSIAAVWLLALSQSVLAAGTPAASFTVYEKDKAGTVQQIGSWQYDPANDTLTGAPFVETLTSMDYRGNMLRYVPFSGQDANTGTTRMSISTKGFYLDDLAAWVAAQNGVPLAGATEFNVSCTDSVPAGSFYFGVPWTLTDVDDRYWYPSYNYANTDSTWDDSTRMPRKAILSIVGSSSRRSNLDPAPTDYSTLLAALDGLFGTAGDGDRMMLLMGQVKGASTEFNLGSNAPKYVDALTFMPAYGTITATVTDVTGSGATATVTSDDGYMKATAGEPVSFTISDVTPGYAVGPVTITDAHGRRVAVDEAGCMYSFTMPASDAAISVRIGMPVDIADVSIATIHAKVCTGSKIKPRLKVTYHGARLVRGVDYKVAYRNNRRLGRAAATITGLGFFHGTKSKAFNIIPGRTKILRVNAARGRATVTWKKPRDAGGVSGFQVAFRAESSPKYRTAGSTRRVHKVVRYLSPGATYEFKVRAFKLIDGTRHYGSWSRSLAVTIR